MRFSAVLVALGALLSGCANAPEPAATAPAFGIEIEELRFDNGMRAVLARTPPRTDRDPRAFVGLYVGYGTASEARPELAHLTEHIVANNRPIVRNYQVNEALRVFNSNAMTRPDFTSFWRVIDPSGLDDIIGTRLNRMAGIENEPSVFAVQIERVAGELERVVGRVTEGGPMPALVLRDAFSPAPLSEAERLPLLRSYTSADAMAEYERLYRPDNAVLVIAGDIDMASTRAIVERRMADVPARTGPAHPLVAEFSAYSGPVVVTTDRRSDVGVAIGFPAPDRDSADYGAFLVLDQFLLGGRSGFTALNEVERDQTAPLARRLAESLGGRDFGDSFAYAQAPPFSAIVSRHYFVVEFTAPRGTTAAQVQAALNAALADIGADLTEEDARTARAQTAAFMQALLTGPEYLALADTLAVGALHDGDVSLLQRLPGLIDGASRVRLRGLLGRYQTELTPRIVLVTPTS